jgi:pilus assembly protein CpaB
MVQKLWNSMTGKNRSLVVFALAIAIAALASIWAYNSMKVAGPDQAKKVDTVMIAVAAEDLPWGVVLTDEKMKTVLYLRDNLPAGSFSNPAALTGRTVISPIRANEPILASRLAPTDLKGGGVAAVVSPNMRAMAVKVDKVIGVSGFIHPGNRVDVLVTLSERKGAADSAIAKTVLENVLVLAAGTEVEQTGKKEKPATVDVITLEVTPQDGEKLALAASEGRLLMSLRNYSDVKNVDTRGTTIPILLSSYTGTTGLSPQAKKVVTRAVYRKQTVEHVHSGPNSYTVEVVQGSDVEQFRFGKGE